MYQRIGKAAYKADLNNTLALDAHFDHPHRMYATIHVAGTNGKGSVSHMLASVLQESGYTVGLYTSPHLSDFRERIRVNGDMIPENYVTEFVEKNRDYFTRLQPSFFEMTVAMALHYFADRKVDIAVIETGLGGRLDSTNIITPLLSVITNISRDHTALLGNTPEAIASEKAGIIKAGIPVVIGTRQPESAPVFEATAASQNAPLLFASDHWKIVPANVPGTFDALKNDEPRFKNLQPDLLGDYQRFNLATVLESISVLRQQKALTLPTEAIYRGIARVTANTGLLGRWQVISRSPYTVLDTAHNEAGLRCTMAQVARTPHKRLHIVLGVVNDKEIDHILPLFPTDATYYFTQASIPRALDAGLLATKAHTAGLRGEVYATVPEAYAAACAAADPEDLIYVGGSTFVVGDWVSRETSP